ncbi:MAG: MBL fold metallo-hydrolase [Acidobacteriaceae bacterium]
MPLPGDLSHINIWCLADGAGFAVVDTGMRSSEAVDAWNSLLDRNLGGRAITRVFATHLHPDHAGMAGWLAARFDCRLWMTRLEYLTCMVTAADTRPPLDAIRFYRAAGWDLAEINAFRERFGTFGKRISPLPQSYRRIVDGEVLVIGEFEWQVVVGAGHSPEHACLYCRELRLLISGDQVLPGISSNVSVHAMEPDADPMAEWLGSLAKLKHEISDDVLVLPAHQLPFRNLHSRLDQLIGEQESSLTRLREALAHPRRVIDLFDALFRRDSFREFGLGLATGETMACLNYLLGRGQITRHLDGDGVAWYQTRGTS